MSEPKCTGPEGPYCWTQRPDPPPIVTKFDWTINTSLDGPPQVVGVALKIPKSKPLVLNFCPWCGVELRHSKPAEAL